MTLCQQGSLWLSMPVLSAGVLVGFWFDLVVVCASVVVASGQQYDAQSNHALATHDPVERFRRSRQQLHAHRGSPRSRVDPTPSAVVAYPRNDTRPSEPSRHQFRSALLTHTPATRWRSLFLFGTRPNYTIPCQLTNDNENSDHDRWWFWDGIKSHFKTSILWWRHCPLDIWTLPLYLLLRIFMVACRTIMFVTATGLNLVSTQSSCMDDGERI